MKVKELGHVVFYVSNLKESVHFYRDILGLNEVARMKLGVGEAVGFSSGRTHHELLLIEVGDKPKKKEDNKPGFYHVGFKIGDSPDDIKRAYKHLLDAGVEIKGASDHTITHSLYMLDPDGNEVELYADVSDEWKTNPAAILSPIKKLNLD